MRALGLLGVACALTLVADVAGAEVRGIQKVGGTRTFAPSQYVPMYPGDNELRLRGPNIQTANAVQVPPGIADVARLQDKGVDSSGIGEVTALIRIKRAVHGKFRVRLVYPGGKHSDTFKARVFRRGIVQMISAPPGAKVGLPIRIRYTGQGFGVAALRGGGPLYTVERLGGSDGSAQFDVTFKQCGTLRLGAGLLHDAQVPTSEVLSGAAGYLGAAKSTIVIGPADGRSCPPAVSGPAKLPFCPVGKRWDEKKAGCVGK
jgi:hypothetical protein